MVGKKRVAATAVTSFGVALTSIYSAPELQAQVVDLTYDGGNATADIINVGSVDFDQVIGSTSAIDLIQFNDTFGRSINPNPPGGGIEFVRVVNLGDVLNAGSFAGAAASQQIGSNVVTPGPFDGTGTVFVGFQTFGGNVGWFTVDVTGAIGSEELITYRAGEFGSGGESVTVGGTTSIPEPSAFVLLAGLAMGAAGIRRRRDLVS